MSHIAIATSPSTPDERDLCIICTSRYNRAKLSFCRCNHCSIQLCVECMVQHHDELLKDTNQISRQLLHSEKNSIDVDTTKCVTDIHRRLDSCIDRPGVVQSTILEERENAKRKAQDDVQELDADLRLQDDSVEVLAKDDPVSVAKRKKFTSDLEKLAIEFANFRITEKENLISIKPDFSVRFDYPSVEIKKTDSTDTELKSKCQTDLQQLQLETNTLDMASQPSTIPKNAGNQPKVNNLQGDVENPFRDADTDGDDKSTNSPRTKACATYSVDRMASDGENIFYTSYEEQGPDIIAYCVMDKGGDGNQADKYRDWKQSRIVDIIWWCKIEEFVCATANGIYTVDYTDKKFKISRAIRGDWCYVRVAANSRQLFAWMNDDDDDGDDDFNGIKVYSANFNIIRKIDFSTNQIRSIVNDSTSFCVTGKVIALICTRKQNGREVFKVTFCDLQMNKLNSILLGECDDDTEIRTNGINRFFITTGTNRFHIIHSMDTKQTIELKNNANTIAVLKNRRIAVSNEHDDIEILTH